MTRSSPAVDNNPPPNVRARFLANRVVGKSYIFPNLVPARTATWTLTLAGREECAPDYFNYRNSYPFYVVEYVAEGRGTVQIGRGRRHIICPGSVFTYAPDMKCQIRTDPEAPLIKFFFALSGTKVTDRLREARLPPGTVRRFRAPAEVLSIAYDVIHEGQRPGAHAAEICLKLVEILLLKTADSVASRGNMAARDERARANFLRCRALIDTHAADFKTLEDVAEAAHLDSASICRLFQRFEGTSPYQYLLRRKMNLAAEFLIDTGGLVKNAAESVGFADPYHFARCFKAIHGVPPSEVRQFRPRAAPPRH